MKDCFSASKLLPFEQALSQMLAAITPVTEQEEISINIAQDRILANDVSSPVNVPPYDNSAMDGYAFAQHSLEQNTSLTLFGTSIAGKPFNQACPTDHCIRIMTGAKMPAGCDTVEMQENTTVDEQQVRFNNPRKLGDNVRKTGEDIQQGQLVYQTGKRLNAIDLGLLASLGVAKVSVFRKLTVALIATGDELKTPEQTLNDGEIFESNSHVLSAMFKRLNVNVINFGIIKDDEKALQQAFIAADEQADAIISCGGVSVGDADYTKTVLEQLGEVGFWKIAMKPGKPFAFGKLPNSVFFGLPGNPVSAMVCGHIFVAPVIRALLGQPRHAAPRRAAPLAMDLPKGGPREHYMRAILGPDGLIPNDRQDRALLSVLAASNVLMVRPPHDAPRTAGDLMDYLPL